MTAPNKPNVGKMYVFMGAMDLLIGIGLAVAALTGLFGPDMNIVAIVGGVIAIVGAGMVVYGRNKLSQADDRRGDLN